MTSNPLKKRPFGAIVRTLSDIANERRDLFEDPSFGSGDRDGDRDAERGNGLATNSTSFDNTSISTRLNSKSSPVTIQHIPSLPNAQRASAILQRIRSEFRNIIQCRGWNVLSITEMCCCGDGIDHCHCDSANNYNANSTSHATTMVETKTAANGKKPAKRRSTKIMPDNVLGYNLTSSSRSRRGRSARADGGCHAIHLRLRHPRTHDFYSYEAIAGTMCHEMAHCEVGPHNARFYEAMDEIEGQYAVFLARGVVVDEKGFPVEGSGNVLGGGTGRGRGNGHGGGGDDVRGRAMEAAEARRGKGRGYGLTFSPSSGRGRSGGYILGGKISKWPMNPKEAARMAAERRRLDSRYCLPCEEVIEILGGDSSDEECHVENYDEITSDCDIEVMEAPLAGIAAMILNHVKNVEEKKNEEEKKEEERNGDSVVAIDLYESEDETKHPAKKKKRNISINGMADVVTSTKTAKPAIVPSTASEPLIICNSEMETSSRVKSKAMSANISPSSNHAIDLTSDSSDETDKDRRSRSKPSILNRMRENPINCVHYNDYLSPFQSRGRLSPSKAETNRAKNKSSKSNATSAVSVSETLAVSSSVQQNNHEKNIHIDSQPRPTTPTCDWTCPRCTFNNPPIILVCDACHLERPCLAPELPIGIGTEDTLFETTLISTENVDMRVMTSSLTVKDKEVEQSRRTFGGFNIYGDKMTPSGTMKHLT
ncbi:hypothetical protein ACHAXS_009240 [Conticribra weissflogii]